MPDIPALIHCHYCGYWSGPTTAEDGQARLCNHCGTSIRVNRYPEHHRNSRVGRNTFTVKIKGKSRYGNWLYDLPANVDPRKHKGVVAKTYDSKSGTWTYHCVADKRKLKEIYDVRKGGIMYGKAK